MSFSSSVRQATKQIGDEAEQIARGTFIALFTAVVKDTPVGNDSDWQRPAPPGYVGGRLRGNWQCTINNPAGGELNRLNESGPITEIVSTIGGPGVYWLTNNLPYANRVEYDGWSHTKAPAGMVRINARRFRELLNRKGFKA